MSLSGLCHIGSYFEVNYKIWLINCGSKSLFVLELLRFKIAFARIVLANNFKTCLQSQRLAAQRQVRRQVRKETVVVEEVLRPAHCNQSCFGTAAIDAG